MAESAFERANFSLAENIQKLGPREKNAVRIVLRGLCETQQTGKEQKPMKIKPDQPFDRAGFNKVLREMGISVPDEASIFQPKIIENSKSLIKSLVTSKPATEHFIRSFVDYQPSPINSEPQK